MLITPELFATENSLLTFVPKTKEYRELSPGMGQAVAERTILRKKDDQWETWGDVANRVALGNSLLCRTAIEQAKECNVLRHHLAKATLLMSGRHLQHGDDTQPERPMEVYTNCSVSATSFALFLLLMSGSGVGRDYSDDIILINWDNAPNVRCVLSHEHPDFDWSAHESVRDALHRYGPDSKNVMWFRVADTREGWAAAVELWENAAFEKIHKDKILILDFSDVRAKGIPIMGMQGRPASGPIPLMNAIMKAASLKGAGLPCWKQAMYVDHFLAECVVVGGARRSARMSTKHWKDKDILEFIRIKRPIEFNGKGVDDVLKMRERKQYDSFLWSSNNSILVDEEFWKLLTIKRTDEEFSSEIAKTSRKIWREITACAYGDGTGEPGIINVDKLNQNNENWDKLLKGPYIGSKKYQIREETELYLSRLAKKASKRKFTQITNPCGEISLSVLSGYCTIADVVPFHADDLVEAEEAFRAATRALIRVNTMDSIYNTEVARTNRIGVGITGVHEFAWKFFGLGFRDLIDEDKSLVFWNALKKFNSAVNEEAEEYSKKLGLVVPHTITTCKPSGSVSKLFALTEGWHLPAMKFYLRWVQFRIDDPLVIEYEKAGYPVRKLKTYNDTVIVGFPTAPTIATIGMDDKLVTAADATLEEQYQWLRLGEKYWLEGNYPRRANQISFTMKYNPKVIDFKLFAETLLLNQRTIKCCSVMPQIEDTSYEYMPEQMITEEEYDALVKNIDQKKEEVDRSHVDCASGSCPIDFRERL